MDCAIDPVNKQNAEREQIHDYHRYVGVGELRDDLRWHSATLGLLWKSYQCEHPARDQDSTARYHLAGQAVGGEKQPFRAPTRLDRDILHDIVEERRQQYGIARRHADREGDICKQNRKQRGSAIGRHRVNDYLDGFDCAVANEVGRIEYGFDALASGDRNNICHCRNVEGSQQQG